MKTLITFVVVAVSMYFIILNGKDIIRNIKKKKKLKKLSKEQEIVEENKETKD